MACDRSVVSSTNQTDRHEIIEMLLTVGLNAINHHKPNNFLIYFFLCTNEFVNMQGLQVGYHMLTILLQSSSLLNKLYVLKTSPLSEMMWSCKFVFSI